MKRISAALMAWLSGAVPGSNGLLKGGHSFTLTTTDGGLTLMFPGKPSGNPRIEREAPQDGCTRTYFEYNQDSLFLNVLVKDCPNITVTTERREDRFAEMRETLQNIAPDAKSPISTRELRWSGGTGAELTRKAEHTEIRLRTYIGDHSAIWLTAIWSPLEPGAGAAALRFIEPL